MKKLAKKAVSLCMVAVLMFGLMAVVAPTEVKASQGWYWAIEPQFHSAQSFYNGTADVTIDENWTRRSIDRDGNETTPLWVFYYGLSVILERADNGTFVSVFIDEDWNIAFDQEFYSAQDFSEGLAAVTLDGNLWGFIDTEGNWAIEPQFRNVALGGFSEGLVAVNHYQHMHWSFIDAQGNTVIEPQFYGGGSFSYGLAVVQTEQGITGAFPGGFAFADREGNLVIEGPFAGAGQFSEGLAPVRLLADGWGFIDKDGNWIIEPQFLFAGSFSEGLAAAWCAESRLWGFIALGDAPVPTQPPAEQPTNIPTDEQPAPPAEVPTLPPAPLTETPATTIIPAQESIRFAIGSTAFAVDGTQQTLDAAPFLAYGRTMVPLRAFAEATGATDVAFADGVVTFSISGQNFTFTIGQPLPDGMGTPVLVGTTTFVPLRYIAEALGATVRWCDDTHAVYIYIN